MLFTMQLPYRKPGKYSQATPDYMLSSAKLFDLGRKLDTMKKRRPGAAAEVARLAELGDFSENVEYQLAKGKLRGLNQRILEIEHQVNRAVVIAPPRTNRISIGHTVTITNGISESTYQILGSSETNPAKGIISHTSPLGAALLGHAVGEKVCVAGRGAPVEYTILKVE